MTALARLVAVLLLATGAGLLVYGANVDTEAFRAPLGWNQLWATPSEVLAWGVGTAIAGLLLLFLFGIKAPRFDKPGQP